VKHGANVNQGGERQGARRDRLLREGERAGNVVLEKPGLTFPSVRGKNRELLEGNYDKS